MSPLARSENVTSRTAINQYKDGCAGVRFVDFQGMGSDIRWGFAD
jgi:hypothetical protein